MRIGKFGMGLVGPGFLASHHIDAIRRLGDVEVVALAGSGQERAQKKAAELGVSKAYGSYEELIARSAIDVIHNMIPKQGERRPAADRTVCTLPAPHRSPG